MSWRRWLPPTLWAAVILLLTSIPIPQTVSVPSGDKLAHLILYGVLGFLSVRAAWQPEAPVRALVLVVCAIAVFAALDELHQAVLASRTADLLDWYADVVGASLGGILASAQLRLRERPS